MKSSVDEIRARFDKDVERFSNLETGQTAAMDSALALDLIAEAAAAATPHASRLLDIGCGAGNYTLKLLQRLPGLDVTLVDLSAPMLTRAEARVRAAGASAVTTLQVDIRDATLVERAFDVIVAAAVLHHLRTDAEWEQVYHACVRALKPGGSMWVFDLVAGATVPLHDASWRRYAEYLVAMGGDDLKDRVLAYVEREDTPRPLFYQLTLMARAGLTGIEVLHKHGCFAAFGGTKPELETADC